MLIKKPFDIRPSEITDKDVYLNRRAFMRAAALAGGAALAGDAAAALIPTERRAKLDGVVPSVYSTEETQNSYMDVTTYNNYYEFGTGKSDPFRYSQDFEPHPWTVDITGEAEITGPVNLEDLVKPHTLEERIYRLRCVEAWSMVIPWVGIPLADIIRQFKPLSSAKYVMFETLHDPKRMPGQRMRSIRWPYTEGLTIAEATNPLTIMAVGVFGEVLPNQNGAPLRLVVPWKYGFKSIKGIVRIHFTDRHAARRAGRNCSRRMSTASTPTSIRMSIIHAGARHSERRIGSEAVGSGFGRLVRGRSPADDHVQRLR